MDRVGEGGISFDRPVYDERYKENAKKDYPSRYEEFSFGEVYFDYYEAKKFSVPKKNL